FRLEVQTLDGAAGKPPLGLEPVEDQRLVVSQHSSHLLHRRQIGLQCPGHPVVEELSREVWTLIVPESLEVFSQQVALDRRQVELEQFAHPGRLFLGEILRTLQKKPATAFENILLPVGLELCDLVAPDL